LELVGWSAVFAHFEIDVWKVLLILAITFMIFYILFFAMYDTIFDFLLFC
jgi:hypothetical protein